MYKSKLLCTFLCEFGGSGTSLGNNLRLLKIGIQCSTVAANSILLQFPSLLAIRWQSKSDADTVKSAPIASAAVVMLLSFAR